MAGGTGGGDVGGTAGGGGGEGGSASEQSTVASPGESHARPMGVSVPSS